jgi:hypothetical protein
LPEGKYLIRREQRMHATQLPPNRERPTDLVLIEVQEEYRKRMDWRNSENGVGNTKFFVAVALFITFLVLSPEVFFVSLALLVIFGALTFFGMMPFTHFSGRN